MFYRFFSFDFILHLDANLVQLYTRSVISRNSDIKTMPPTLRFTYS